MRWIIDAACWKFILETLELPDDIGGGLFDIFGYDAADALFLLAHDWNGANIFDLGSGGVSRFRVMGIETGVGLDAANSTAFVTGLTFTGSGLVHRNTDACHGHRRRARAARVSAAGLGADRPRTAAQTARLIAIGRTVRPMVQSV